MTSRGRKPLRAHAPGSPGPDGGLPVRPMLATAAAAPPSGAGWVFEPKLDGYRLLADARPEGARLFSRSGRDVTEELAPIARAVEEVSSRAGRRLLLDGEVVVQLESGGTGGGAGPRFQHMQRFRDYGQGQLRYYVFDLLRDGEELLTGTALSVRRKRLQAVLRGRKVARREPVTLVPRLTGDGAAAYRAAVGAGHEGIVAKREDARYEAGRRSEAWLKVKRVTTEDLVVGGFTRGTGRRSRTLGALLVGNRSEAGLVYAGHVGTGFDDATLADLHARLTRLRTARCPFVERPPANEPATWVRPELVVEVRYVERTEGGILRLPVFVRLRDDKSAAGSDEVEAVASHGPPGAGTPGAASRLAAVGQLEQLDTEGELRLGRHTVRVTSLEKALWPAPPSKRMMRGATAALTKRDLLRYLINVSPALLEHLRHRPVTLTRYPNGAGRPGFYQRHWEAGATPPDYIKTVVPAEDEGSESDPGRPYLLVQNLATLLHAGQLGALELHPWYVRADSPLPDFMVFDLDSYLYAGHERRGEEPAPHAAGFDAARRAAWLLKAELDALDLPAFVKTSGKTGLHVFVPIQRRLPFVATHAMARTICEHLARRHPRLLTTSWAVPARRGKVFLDYNQNARGKTLAAAYSPRAAPGAPVSTPVEWDELDALEPWRLTIHTVPRRLAERGDPWRAMLGHAVDLKARLRVA